MADELRTQYAEGSPWFWKIFGGAIMGIISILLVSHITNINHTIDRSFLDLRSEIKDMRQAMDVYKDRLVVLEQGSYKEKLATVEQAQTTIAAATEIDRQKVAAADAQIAALKDELKTVRESCKELTKQVQEVREKLAAADAKEAAKLPPNKPDQSKTDR